MAWIPIQYREFYDIPRAFVVGHAGSLYLFTCDFDEQIDDYPDQFGVYRLPAEMSERIDAASWIGIQDGGVFVRSVAVKNVRFDPTLRAAIDDEVFDFV